MATESRLKKVHVFPSMESYEANKGSVASDDLALIPEEAEVDLSKATGTLSIGNGGTGVTSMAGTDYSVNRPRGIVLQTSTPSSVPNGCIVGVYE